MLKGNATKNMFEAYTINTQKFLDSTVKVGIPAGSKESSDNYPDGTPLLVIAATHEYGSHIRNIPQRSFLRVPMIKDKEKINKMIFSRYKAVGDNTLTAEKGLNQIGSLGVSISKSSFRNNNWAANKPATIKAKKGKDTPLINTGQLRQSITYQVEGI